MLLIDPRSGGMWAMPEEITIPMRKANDPALATIEQATDTVAPAE
jgi:hypothetical protein